MSLANSVINQGNAAMLNVVVQEREGLVNIALSEDLDAPSVSTATEPCSQALRRQPHTLILQLERIQFIDSHGVRFLIALVEEVEGAGCACALVTGGNPRVHRVCQVLQLEDRLPLYLTRTSALRELAERSRRPRRGKADG